MATLALILYIVYFGIAFVLRSLLQKRRTGSAGFHGLGGAPGSAGRAMRVMDAWIAATAMAHGAAVCTQDAAFDAAADAGLVEVIRL